MARAALGVIRDEGLVERSARLGTVLLDALKTIDSPRVHEIRGIGLLAGVELREPARPFCEQLLERGVLCKETHERVIRLAPPLVIDEVDLLWMVEQLRDVLRRA